MLRQIVLILLKTRCKDAQDDAARQNLSPYLVIRTAAGQYIGNL